MARAGGVGPTRSALVAGLLGIVGVVAAGCADGDPRSGDAIEAGDPETPALVVRNQETDGASLLLDSFAAPGEGAFVVAYRDGGGAPGERVAVSEHLEGTVDGDDLELAFGDDELPEGSLWLIVHADTDVDGEFDADADAPLTNDGGVIAAQIEVAR